tara:strand:+ start:32565 stop:32696 length:132 start_codon:yes stop_codon:yes gene_type:complete
MPDRDAVRQATEAAAREGRPYCPHDAWAVSRAALLAEMWAARR